MPNVIGPSFEIPASIAPRDVSRSSVDRRRAFWGAVAIYVIEAKERELRKGVDIDGNPLATLASSTIKHRKSAMGPAHAHAKPLTPAYALSRTRSLFTAEVNDSATGVICWWLYDAITGASWGEILEYHRTGSDQLPIRDVIGLAPASLASVKRQAAAWWASNRPAPAYRPTGVEPGRVTPLPEPGAWRRRLPPGTEGLEWLKPSETGIPRTMAAPAKAVQTFRIGGHTYTLQGGLGLKLPPQVPPSFGAAIPKPRPPKPAPAPKPAPKPPIPPVGAAIEIKAKSSRVARAAKTVFDAIEQVHGDGNLPTIPFLSNNDQTYLGSLTVTKTGKIIMMETRESGPFIHETIAHETGHFLDYGGIPRTRPTFDEERNWRAEELFKDFFKAVDASDSIKTLNLRATQEAVVKTQGALINTYTLDQKHIQYLLQENEIWARAYSQWIAYRSGQADLLADHEYVRSRGFHAIYPTQWTESDFHAIGQAMDEIFTRLGWLR